MKYFYNLLKRTKKYFKLNDADFIDKRAFFTTIPMEALKRILPLCTCNCARFLSHMTCITSSEVENIYISRVAKPRMKNPIFSLQG